MVLKATRGRVDRPDMDNARALPARTVLTHACASGCCPGLAPLPQSERGQEAPREGLLSGRHIGAGLVLPTLALSWRAVCSSQGVVLTVLTGGEFGFPRHSLRVLMTGGSKEIVMYPPLASPHYS